MPIQPEDFQTGGALQSRIAASLLRHRETEYLPKAGDLVGSYRVINELGRGGMAIVYRAERADGEYEQQVALKWMLDSQPDSTTAELFRRERQALAGLNHPNIARLLDGGRTLDGRPWFAMELIDGQPIDQHCIEQNLPLAHRLDLFIQICGSVTFLHARGLIHRDIKPSNVLVDAGGQVKLLDFGIAQLLGKDDVLAAEAYTPGFASPEQQRGEMPTVASDIFQLGRLLECLLGRRCQTATTLVDASPQVAIENMPDGAERLPSDLRAIISMACAGQPTARHATSDALARDVRCLIDRRPVSARPRNAGYIATRYVQRHPVAVGAGLLGLLIVLMGTAFFTLRLQHERDSANYQARVATSVLDFLREDLLAAADPGTALGHELSVRDALDRASDTVALRFADKPIEHAAIRTTLARLYDQLGRYDAAEREARRAVALARTGDAPAQARYSADATLIGVLLARGKLDEADSTINDILTPQNQVSIATNERAELSLFQARLANLRGDFEEALGLAVAVRQKEMAEGRADSPLALWAAEQAAANLQMLGRQEEALPLLQAMHSARLAQLGPLHPSTLLSAHEIGLLKRHQGQNEEALTWLQAALENRRNVLGENHPATLSSGNELATVLQGLQRFDEAEAMFSHVLDARLQLLGEEHQFTRNSMSNLGLLYSVSGRLEKAAPLYERALAIETRLIGESHPDTIALMHNIAGLYRKQGRIDEALAMHDRVLGNALRSLGEDAWQTALFRAGRALTLQEAKRYDEADRELSTSIATLESALGPDHPRTLRARDMRAALRNGRGAGG